MSQIKQKHKSHVENVALGKVPAEERQHWISITFIQAGIMICVPSLMLGGLLAQGLSIYETIIAGVVGYAIATLIFTLQALQGHDLGVPTIVAASSAFGREACRVSFSILFLVSLIGWFALQANICGAAFASLLSNILGFSIPVWISTMIWGIIMLSTAVYGIDGLKFLNYIAIPMLIIISMYGVYKAVSIVGIAPVINHKPDNPMTLFQGIALSISFMAVGAVLAPDITRYQRNRLDTVKSTVLGVMPAGIIMFIMGALLSITAGSYDLIVVLTKFGLPFLGMIILIFATWTTNTANAYSAGLDYIMLFKLKDSDRAKATIITGLIGTILGAVGIINYFQAFLNILGYCFMPVAGVMIADYWIKLKGNPEKCRISNDYNLIALIAWCIGVFVSIFFKTGIPVVNGFLVSILFYLLFSPSKS